MAGEPQRVITDQEVTEFRRDGAVILRGALPDAWVQLGAAALRDVRFRPDPHMVSWGGPDGAASWIWHLPSSTNPSLRHLVLESPLARLAAELMRSSTVAFIGDILYCKEAGDMLPTDWHRDRQGLPVSGDQHCILWTCFDQVPRGLGLEFVRASHRDAHDEGPSSPGVPPDLAIRRSEYDIIGWDSEPGDIVAFHVATLHGAPGASNVPVRRASYSIRWGGDDVRYTGVAQPTPFPTDDWEGLVPGARVVSLHKPQVWPAYATAAASPSSH